MVSSGQDDGGSDSFEDVESGDGIIKLMLIFCSVGFVVFTFVYAVLWRRGKHNNEQAQIHEEDGDGDGDNKTVEFRGDDDDDAAAADDDSDNNNEQDPERQQRTPRRREQGRIRYSEAHEPNRERQPGEPYYDKFLVGGTMSLGIILWVGATIVLIMSLTSQSDHKAASKSDFKSLGPTACQIINASSYAYFDTKLTSQQTTCIEQWEYLVEVTSSSSVSLSTSSSPTVFVSAPIAVTSCGVRCDLCQREGPNHYAGVDRRAKGVTISSDATSPTLVECWEPTIPVDDLSDFYNCGAQRQGQGEGDGDEDSDGTCYLLEDTAAQLDTEQQSSQIGLIVACCGYGAGLLLMLLSSYWIRRNRKIREMELGQVEEEKRVTYHLSTADSEAPDEAGCDDDNMDHDSSLDHVADGGIDDADTGAAAVAVAATDLNGESGTSSTDEESKPPSSSSSSSPPPPPPPSASTFAAKDESRR